MTMTHTSSSDKLRFGTPVLVLVLNVLLTTGAIVALKLHGFGWLLALLMGSFGGAAMTLVAVFALVTLLTLSERDTFDPKEGVY